MKRLLIIICTLFSLTASAQYGGSYTPMLARAYQFKFVKVDSGLNVLKTAYFQDTVRLKGVTRLTQLPAVTDSSDKATTTEWVKMALKYFRDTTLQGISGTDSSAYSSTTQLSDTSWTLNRLNGLSDTFRITSPGGTSGWGLTGNAGTDDATNFIGTTDNQDLVFKRNNTEAGRIADLDTYFGRDAGSGSSGAEATGIGAGAVNSNTGNAVVGIGNNALGSNTGDFAIGIGVDAGAGNTHDNVAIFGYAATADSSNQFVFNSDGTIDARFNFGKLTADRKFHVPNASGTFVLTVNGEHPDENGNITVAAGGYPDDSLYTKSQTYSQAQVDSIVASEHYFESGIDLMNNGPYTLPGPGTYFVVLADGTNALTLPNSPVDGDKVIIVNVDGGQDIVFTAPPKKPDGSGFNTVPSASAVTIVFDTNTTGWTVISAYP